MDCPEAIEHLYTYLDQELTMEVQAAVRAHIEACVDCSDHFEFERAFLLFVEARCRANKAPPDLRKRVFEQIFTDERRAQ